MDWHKDNGSLTWIGKDKGSLTLIGIRTKEVLHGLAQGQWKSYLDWHKDKGSLTLIGTRTMEVLLELAWTKEVFGLAQGQRKSYLDWHKNLAQGQRKSYLDWHKDNGSLTWTGTRTMEVLHGLAQGQW